MPERNRGQCRNSVLVVMDERGQPLLQCQRANELFRILTDSEPYRSGLASVAVESLYVSL